MLSFNKTIKDNVLYILNKLSSFDISSARRVTEFTEPFKSRCPLRHAVSATYLIPIILNQ